MDVVAIVHCDLDGYAAGAIIKRRYPQAETIITNYGKSIPNWKIPTGAMVIVADFSLTFEEFKALQMKGHQIVWLDHHENNYKKLEAAGFVCEGVRRADKCGAEIAWEYFYPNQPVPRAIQLIGDFDLWQWKWREETLAFIYGMDLFDARPNSRSFGIWSALLDNDATKLQQIHQHGKPIADYVTARYKLMSRDLAYRTTFHGKKLIVANNKQANSMFFDYVDKTGANAVMLINWFGDFGKYRCSVYSPDDEQEVIDIALAFGGNGHPKAAGFSSATYPVDRPSQGVPVDIETIVSEYTALAKSREGSAIIKQCTGKSDTIALRAQSYFTHWMGFPCIAINHHFLPVLMKAIPYNIDVVHPITGAVAQIALAFVLTNTNQIRVCVSPLDTSTTLDSITSKLKEAAIPFIERDGSVWFYTDEIPVQLDAQIR